MKDINLFTAGQFIYNNVAILKATNKFTQEKKEFYIPFKNSEINDFFDNINNFTLYYSTFLMNIKMLINIFSKLLSN